MPMTMNIEKLVLGAKKSRRSKERMCVCVVCVLQIDFNLITRVKKKKKSILKVRRRKSEFEFEDIHYIYNCRVIHNDDFDSPYLAPDASTDFSEMVMCSRALNLELPMRISPPSLR